jgi:hypothetical protein
MEKRYFTVAEANELVPTLEEAFGRMLRLRAQLRAVAAEFEAHGEELDEEALTREDGPPELTNARGRGRALFEALGDELSAINDLGVQVKDLETGLCDFVARREGRDVLLCWRFGEKSIGFWHELTTGFAGRRPIDAQLERLPH